jgi:hypothetical protein
MIRFSMLPILILAAAITVLAAPAGGQAPVRLSQQGETKKEVEKDDAEKKAAEKKEAEKKQAEKSDSEKKGADKKEADKSKTFLGQFDTGTLAGGAVNNLKIPVQLVNLPQLPENTATEKNVSIKWAPTGFENSKFPWTNSPVCPKEMDSTQSPESENVYVRSRRVADDDNLKTILAVQIPSPPCWWPLSQDARLSIRGSVVADAVQTRQFFDETISVSVFWIPFFVTLAALAMIYPGCAMVAYYVADRRYEKDCAEARKKGEPMPAPPTFWGKLDPVQITANPHGRASLGKLQIFGFSVLVFGLLFYYQFRYGILAGMSADVMLLMGISAVGAVGGKLVYAKKRRLSLESWAWLRRKGWLPAGKDVQPRARWSELLVDGDTKEFDPYSFQMAVFSLVVAVGLVRSGLTGLGTFKIPAELLQLLGLSQVVYVGGKAAEPSPYEDLEKQLKDVRDHETHYLALKSDTPKEGQAGAEAKEKLDAELNAFRESVAQAATMFWSVYAGQLEERPAQLGREKIDKMIPGADCDLPKK